MIETDLDPHAMHLVVPAGTLVGHDRYLLPRTQFAEAFGKAPDALDGNADDAEPDEVPDWDGLLGEVEPQGRCEPQSTVRLQSEREPQSTVGLQGTVGVLAGCEPFQLSDAQLIDEIETTGRQLAKLTARRCGLLAEAETRTCDDRLGLSTAGWLVHQNSHSQRRAKAEVKLAAQIVAEPILAAALADGRVSVEQAERIARGMGRVPEQFTGPQRDAVVEQLVGFAAEFGPDGLSVLVNRAVEVVAPEVADQADQAALERAERRHARDRHLSLRRDADDSWVLSGKLPPTLGTRLATQLTAIATSLRHTDTTGELTWPQAMADALEVMSGHYGSCRMAPKHGGDHPRIMVTVELATLLSGQGGACLVDSDTPITATQARLLACDAGIIPVVLDGNSEPLDVGRERRLFTGTLRQAIILRDRGCSFPGCDRPPTDCEVHHIKPWWAGGETCLPNGILLCEPHHHLVEPNPNAPPDSQWEPHLDGRGLPEFTVPLNPRHPERGRPTRQHHRHRVTNTPSRQ